MKVTQEQAIEVLLSKGNCFLTGAGGTGKSYIINQVMDVFRTQDILYSICGSTGRAAEIVGGNTVHSFMGIGVKTDLSEIVSTGYFRTKIYPILEDLQVLIIDEISMLGANTMTLIDQIFRHVRKNKLPFGGCRIIIVGDPFQLPPVKDYFFFNSESYWDANFQILNLTVNYRATNKTWNSILKKIRVGVIDDDVVNMFYRRFEKKPPRDITRIVSTNWEADKINKDKLSVLSTSVVPIIYNAYDPDKILGEKDSKEYKGHISDFFKNRLIKQAIEIKVGAWVMMIVNDTKEFKYVNGTTGIITEISDSEATDSKLITIKTKTDEIKVKSKVPFDIEKTILNPNYGGNIKDEFGEVVFDDREHVKKIAQIYACPFILAWAITTHKSQGLTLTEAQINLEKGFENGMAYVALSRVTSEEGIYLDSIPSETSLRANDSVIEYVTYNIAEFNTPMKKILEL